ncbi:MAG: hypothetical protein WA063_02605, partial [Minisyncoccia bacterium]
VQDNIEAGVSGSSQGNSASGGQGGADSASGGSSAEKDISGQLPANPDQSSNKKSGSASGGQDEEKEGSKKSDKKPEDNSKKPGGIGDKIRDKTAGAKKGLNERADKLKEGAKNRVKNTGAYKLAETKLAAARAVKEKYKKQAEEKFNKMIGERGRKALEVKKKAMEKVNLLKKKAVKLKKALAVKAKKSKASGKSVILVLIFTLTLALIVDGLDIIGTLGVELGAIPTVIAYLINMVSSFAISALWFIVFSGSKGKGSKQSKVIIRSILILFGLENVPIIELLPFNAIAVILNYIDFKAGQKEANQ